MMRAPLDRSLLEIRDLSAEDNEAAARFTCDDEDLDDFLRTDAWRLQEHHVVQTFVAIYDGELAGYAAVLVNSVELKPNERKRIALHFNDHPIVPALKVARLAVSHGLRSTVRGLGEELMRVAYDRAITLSEYAGCRLITVDAYPKSVGFYEKLGFRLSRAERYSGQEHPSMWFDVFAESLPAWIIG